MNAVLPFLFQFFWFLTAWSAIASLFVVPELRRRAPDDALAICILPQLFRVLGVGLLVPNLAPGMPPSFAIATAAGDSLTALLALVAVVSLHRRSGPRRLAAWACTLVGMTDLAIALPHAASIGAAQFLAAQWFVATVAVPLMLVSHALTLMILLRHDHARGKA